MKKLSCIAVIFFLMLSVNAQEFRKFKFEMGDVFALPSSKEYTVGIGFYMHPQYYIDDHVNIGFKEEWAIIGRGEDENSEMSFSGITSYLITSHYYWTTSRVRAYWGTGIGIYSLGTIRVKESNGEYLHVNYGNKFGVAPCVGIDVSHLTFNLAYNAIMGTSSNWTNQNYLTLGIGIFFGGGKK